MKQFVCTLALLSLHSAAAPAFELASPAQSASVLVPAGEPECVRLAAEDLVSDIRKITGRTPDIVRRVEDCGTRSVVLASLDRPESAAWIRGRNRWRQPRCGWKARHCTPQDTCNSRRAWR